MKPYDAEMAVLGCIVINGELFAEANGELTVGDFEADSSKRLFGIMKKLYADGKSIDIVTISAEGNDDDKLFAYNCSQTVPVLSAYRDYIQLVKDGSACRAARTIVLQMNEAVGMLGDVGDLPRLQSLASELSSTVTRSSGTDEMDATEAFVSFAKQMKSDTPREYIKTGFTSLDSKTFIERGDYIIVGGESSSGKTAITLNMMMNIASKYNVVYFSLETSNEKIRDRIMSGWVDLPLWKIKGQQIEQEDWARIAERSDALIKKKFTIVNAAGRTVSWIQSKAMKLKADVVFIDYMGLIKGESAHSRYEEMSKISVALRTMAQTTGMVVFALCQLNRDGYGVPSMKSLKDSSQIENDADLILLLYIDEGEHYLIVAKNKEGQRGKIRFAFDGERQTFRELYDVRG